jgi:hypothetical protein
LKSRDTASILHADDAVLASSTASLTGLNTTTTETINMATTSPSADTPATVKRAAIENTVQESGPSVKKAKYGFVAFQSEHGS